MEIGKLKGHVPASVLTELPAVIAQFSINTPLRLAHFLAQCSHESRGFSCVEENLNYSATRLAEIFGRHFKPFECAKYAHHPKMIGARVYASRMGNGNEASGDGYAYRGRGYIQLTGKDNYNQLAKFIGNDVVANPDLVATQYPLLSAAFFFEKNKLWGLCDKGATIDVVRALTKRVNGGTLGLSERNAKFSDLYYQLVR